MQTQCQLLKSWQNFPETITIIIFSICTSLASQKTSRSLSNIQNCLISYIKCEFSVTKTNYTVLSWSELYLIEVLLLLSGNPEIQSYVRKREQKVPKIPHFGRFTLKKVMVGVQIGVKDNVGYKRPVWVQIERSDSLILHETTYRGLRLGKFKFHRLSSDGVAWNGFSDPRGAHDECQAIE